MTWKETSAKASYLKEFKLSADYCFKTKSNTVSHMILKVNEVGVKGPSVSTLVYGQVKGH